MSKNHLGEAIESAVEKTLNAATEATSPQGEEYWYNLATGEVERGQQSAVTSLWGPSRPTKKPPTPWTAPANATRRGTRTAACSKTQLHPSSARVLERPGRLHLAEDPRTLKYRVRGSFF